VLLGLAHGAQVVCCNEEEFTHSSVLSERARRDVEQKSPA
jgi:hypothetical protein